jgi:hypothetical protein
MKRKFENIKVGDLVFVVHQQKRFETERRSEIKTVLRVGRKFAFITMYGKEHPFCLATGRSVHKPDSNARVNGFGFDVYLDREEYELEDFNYSEKKRLEGRICRRFGSIIDLSPEAVRKIHDVLDADGVTA